jgi:hypothetical protein
LFRIWSDFNVKNRLLILASFLFNNALHKLLDTRVNIAPVLVCSRFDGQKYQVARTSPGKVAITRLTTIGYNKPIFYLRSPPSATYVSHKEIQVKKRLRNRDAGRNEVRSLGYSDHRNRDTSFRYYLQLFSSSTDDIWRVRNPVSILNDPAIAPLCQ